MALINNIIPVQNFELILSRIAEIATLELTNQKTLSNSSDPVNVFKESLSGFNHSEILRVNVMYDGTGDVDEHQAGSMNQSRYFVDVYASGKSGVGVSGGEDSSTRLHRCLGRLRYIFSNTIYRTLGFNPGVIGGVNVNTIQIAALDRKEDTSSITMGRLSIHVNHIETQPLETGLQMQEALTAVKLDLTEQGFKYSINS